MSRKHIDAYNHLSVAAARALGLLDAWDKSGATQWQVQRVRDELGQAQRAAEDMILGEREPNIQSVPIIGTINEGVKP